MKKLLLASIALSALTATAPAVTISGPTVNPANGHTYYLVAPETWAAAEAEAITLGGHLATINDAAENAWVLANFAGPAGTAFIGYNDFASEGSFVWSSGQTPGYTNWAPGEPNDCCDGVPDGGENAVQMYGDGTWNDIFNDTAFAGVVEVGGSVPEGGSTLVMLSLGLGAFGFIQKRKAAKK